MSDCEREYGRALLRLRLVALVFFGAYMFVAVPYEITYPAVIGAFALFKV